MDDGAAVYYNCSSCRNPHVRDTEVHRVPELGLLFCPGCAKDLATLTRIAEGLRNLPDPPGKRLGG